MEPVDVSAVMELMAAQGEAPGKPSQRRTARVLRVDADGTPWVRIDGGADETPCTSSTAELAAGDSVTVEIGGLRARVVGSTSQPSISSERAAQLIVPVAEAASRAQGMAASATASAQEAQRQADAATESAQSAAQAASDAQESADAAADAADVADGKAEEAIASAGTAKEAAGSALVQLATVEDVVGTATWIAEHGTYEPTEDAAVDDSKVYYERTGSGTQADPWVYTAVAEPTDEGLSGYYELHVEQAVSQYVSTHLALTDAGLYVLADASGYKLLLANTGTSVIDPDGHVTVTYGSTISFDSSRAFSIGNQDAYVLFTPATQSEDAKVVIGGNVVLGESRTLSELMAEVDGTIVFKVTEAYSQDASTVTLTAHVYKGGQDTASGYQDSCFAWYRKNEDGAPEVPLGNGRTITVSRSDVGFGAAIKCNFTPPNDSVLLDSDDDALTDSGGTPLAARTPSGDYVRVADLEATTTVFDTDKLMLVGNEEEQLVTIAALKDVFGDGNAIKTTYAKLASPALTGTPTAPTAAAGTNTTQIATTAFVANAVGTATAGALQYKGTVAAESTITGAAYKKGWYYVVSTAGTYVGKVCEVGDMLIAKQDKTSTPANDWDAIQSNIEVLSNSEIDTLWAAA